MCVGVLVGVKLLKLKLVGVKRAVRYVPKREYFASHSKSFTWPSRAITASEESRSAMRFPTSPD